MFLTRGANSDGIGILTCVLGSLLITGVLALFCGSIAGVQENHLQGKIEYSTACMEDCHWLVRPVQLEEEVASRMSLLVDADAPIEFLKAFSVVLRSELLARGLKASDSYLSMESQVDESREALEQCRKAAESTKGIYLAYNHQVIAPLWTKVSNGMTRDGEENHMKEKPYLRKLACKEDILSGVYVSTVEWTKERFLREFAKELAKEDQTTWTFGWPEMVCERDSSDYVLKIQLGQDKKTIDGGTFAARLGLSSPCFTWKYLDDTIVFQVKGYGHGYGMSLNQAQSLAKEGNDFMKILAYFYPGTKLDKCY